MKGETRTPKSTVVNIIPASAAALEERAIRFRFRFRRRQSERSARGSSSSSSSADGCALLVFVEDVNSSRSSSDDDDGVFLIVIPQNAGAKLVADARQRARIGRGDRHHLRLSSQKQARAL